MSDEITVAETGLQPINRRLGELIPSIRRIVREDGNPRDVGFAVAELLQPYLAEPDLLTNAQLEADPLQYRQHILHVEPDGSFSLGALVWLPGQATPIHDHVSWCVVGVYRGSEFQTKYELRGVEASDAHLHPVAQSRSLAGTVEAFTPPGDIHEVANGGDALAVSIHVYGADLKALGCSIRRRYDLPIR